MFDKLVRVACIEGFMCPSTCARYDMKFDRRKIGHRVCYFYNIYINYSQSKDQTNQHCREKRCGREREKDCGAKDSYRHNCPLGLLWSLQIPSFMTSRHMTKGIQNSDLPHCRQREEPKVHWRFSNGDEASQWGFQKTALGRKREVIQQRPSCGGHLQRKWNWWDLACFIGTAPEHARQASSKRRIGRSTSACKALQLWSMGSIDITRWGLIPQSFASSWHSSFCLRPVKPISWCRGSEMNQ